MQKEKWHPYRLERSAEMNDRYRNPDNHPKGPWKATPLYAKRKGSEKERNFRFKFKNGVEWSAPPGTSPRFPDATLRQMDENDEIWFGSDGKANPSRKTFLSELKISAPPTATVWLHTDVGNNHEAREQSKVFNLESPFPTPKPERLIQRILDISTAPGDLVLDSFLGSGTTAAVAHKMGRRWIGIEMGKHAVSHCAPRLRKVVDGEQGGISKAVNWQGGGGFRFFRLGPPVFQEDGRIHLQVTFHSLAAHVWFSETHSPLPFREGGGGLGPLLGIYNGTAYYLLFNGILGDQAESGGNVLTRRLLRKLPQFAGPKVIYGEVCLLEEATLRQENIIFKKIPYQIKAG